MATLKATYQTKRLTRVVVCLPVFLSLFLPVNCQPANIIRVRYGYFAEALPIHAGCARGWFDLDLQQKGTYYKVECYPQTSGNFAASRLDNLQLDIANLGSTPWAQAVARGVDAKAVYISEYKGDSQGIYVRPNQPEYNYTGIVNPFDLVGRTVGVPFGSTIHYQLLFLVDISGLSGMVEFMDLSPSEIIAAWDSDPPTIDAAACWGEARLHVLNRNGRPLVTAGTLSDWGRPTFVDVAATRTFADEHQDFMLYFVGMLSRLNDSFQDALGAEDALNVARWDALEPAGTSLLPSIVDALMIAGEKFQNPSFEEIITQRKSLDLFVQQTALEQISCDYLGPSPGSCEKPTLQHIALTETADFLLAQKALSTIGPLAYSDENCATNTSAFCGTDILDGWYLDNARKACTGCVPIGPYPEYTSNSINGPDELLAALEERDELSGKLPYASNEIGRAFSRNFPSGDSTCTFNQIVSTTWPVTGSFGDGANAEEGKSYSDNLSCRWVVRGSDCPDSSSSCQSLVTVTFQRLRVWSGDYIRIYSDPNNDCETLTTGSSQAILLAQLSGFYENDITLPSIGAKGCIAIEFETDGNEERVYSGTTGDGFLLTFNRDASQCQSSRDCNSSPCENGVCRCGENKWGVDCSFTNYCLGRTYSSITQGETVTLSSSKDLSIRSLLNGQSRNPFATSPSLLYPNDLNCTFEILASPDTEFLKVEIIYDLELTYDLLSLNSGSDQELDGSSTHVVLTGLHSPRNKRETYYLPTKDGVANLHLTTDTRGRRQGFHAVVTIPLIRGQSVCPHGMSGEDCEIAHCLANDRLSQPKSDNEFAYGSVVSQSTTAGISVRAMPWAPEGGCNWLFDIPVRDWQELVALRLVFNLPLDLEPHPVSSIGDKLIISADEDFDFFVEKCDSDEECSLPWQTGTCGAAGGCGVRTTLEIPITRQALRKAKASLVTDRNDGDRFYSGVDFDLFGVRACPSQEKDIHCADAGGECIDGFCICKSTVPCACRCDGEPPQVVQGLKVEIVIAVVLLITIVFMCIFCCYRRRKIQRSRQQKGIIEAKEAELEAFRDSVVGMRTAIKDYIPMTKDMKRISTVVTPTPKSSSTNVVWCWRETEAFLSNHQPDKLYGNPNDCWIRYDDDSTRKLELAFQAGAADCSPLANYIVNFSKMLQTKTITGFTRDVCRFEEKLERAAASRQVKMDEIDVGERIPEELTEEPQMVLVEGDIIQISNQRQDGWAFGTKLYHADEGLSRSLLESATAGFDDAPIYTDTGWFMQDATRVPSGEDLAVLKSSVGDTGALDPPSHWNPVVDPTLVEQHLLDKKDDERNAVVNEFLSTLKPPLFSKQVKVVKVERIQNLAMWQSYVVKRQTICYRETGQQELVDDLTLRKAIERFERRWLWHATNLEVIDKILQQGFNRSFCGKNATMYGKGVYFARDASYSAHPAYAVPDAAGVQYMLACRVMVGEYCIGVKDAVTPDFRDHARNILYDSTVGVLSNDSMASPSIYVTYHDAQAYPEYLIAFKCS